MKKTYLLLLAGMFASVVFANNKQTVKIDGNVSDKTVTEITFDGDNVTLNYADNSSETKDMSLVSLSFSYDSTTGINKIEEVKKSLQGKVFNLNGQLVGNSLEGLSKGIYIVNGKKVVVSNILGQVVANTVITSDNATIAAPAGVVVVAVEGEAAVKAIVK